MLVRERRSQCRRGYRKAERIFYFPAVIFYRALEHVSPFTTPSRVVSLLKGDLINECSL